MWFVFDQPVQLNEIYFSSSFSCTLPPPFSAYQSEFSFPRFVSAVRGALIFFFFCFFAKRSFRNFIFKKTSLVLLTFPRWRPSTEAETFSHASAHRMFCRWSVSPFSFHFSSLVFLLPDTNLIKMLMRCGHSFNW